MSELGGDPVRVESCFFHGKTIRCPEFDQGLCRRDSPHDEKGSTTQRIRNIESGGPGLNNASHINIVPVLHNPFFFSFAPVR